MKFSMEVQDLLDGLNNVTRALAVRPVKQILEGVLIDAQEDKVTLTCSNGSLTIETCIRADVAENGRVVLPGRIFAEMIRKLPSPTVSITVQQNWSTKISCGTFKATLAGMNAIEFPDMPMVNSGVSLSIPQNIFREMISRVVFAIAVDESKPVLTGCLLEVTPEEARLVALDGYRLAMQKVVRPFELPEGRTEFRAIIPGRVMNELSKIMADDADLCEMSFDKNRMEARFANTKVCTVLLAGEYIDYRKILPAEFKTVATTNLASVQDAVDRASLMAREGKNNLIKMSFTGSELFISSTAELGDVNEAMDVVLDGDPIDIAFNAKYISEVIRSIDDDKLCMHLNSNVSPCVFSPEDDDRYLYLVLPVRVFAG